MTEVTTHVDLVHEQPRVAAGEPMSLAATPPRSGYAVSMRICAAGIAPGEIARITALSFALGWESTSGVSIWVTTKGMMSTARIR